MVRIFSTDILIFFIPWTLGGPNGNNDCNDNNDPKKSMSKENDKSPNNNTRNGDSLSTTTSVTIVLQSEEYKALLKKNTDLLLENDNLRRDLEQTKKELEEARENCTLYETLMGVRNEIYDQVDQFYPTDFPKVGNDRRYWKCVITIKMSSHPVVVQWRNLISEVSTVEYFCHLDETVFGVQSKMIHLTPVPAECLSIDIYRDLVKANKELVKALTTDQHTAIETVLIVHSWRKYGLPTQKLNISDTNNVTKKWNVSKTPYHCVKLSNVPFRRSNKNGGKDDGEARTTTTGPRIIPALQIKSFFKKCKEAKENLNLILETKETFGSPGNTGTVVVVFNKPRHAALAILNMKKYINGYSVDVDLVHCDEWKERCTEEGRVDLTLSKT